jgi:cyclopropane fatty-acyl-phospholipid synthase-like methyltransferase/ABC-type nitrate/sulfonate/bicarbonate transport system substrate-binding protein
MPTSQKTTFRIGGVPEHFNYPWKIALEQNLFADSSFGIQWTDYPGGTGAMCQDLREEKLDIALMLTEGAIADIVRGNSSKIIGTYVLSPLTWGIHTHAKSDFNTLADLENSVFAISRFQSGSHLMAFVNAEQQGWDFEKISFELVGNFEGARKALKSGEADAFMWEKYTTQPTVKSGEWRRIGECITPWPAFMIVVREEIIEKHRDDLKQLLQVILEQALPFYDTRATKSYISQKYTLDLEDVEAWYAQTKWLCQPKVLSETLQLTQKKLFELRIIAEILPNDKLFDNLELPQSPPKLSSLMYQWRVDSLQKALAQKGKSEGKLTVKDLTDLGHLDQYHYLEVATCYDIIQELALDSDKYILDIGSGVGGTARVLAEQSNCRVMGVELQKPLNDLAQELNKRVGLEDKIELIGGDFMEFESAPIFDHFISLMVFIHLPQRAKALQLAYQALKSNGSFFIEDLIIRRPLSSEEEKILTESVSAVSLTSLEAYRKDLKNTGFGDLRFKIMNDVWQPWTQKRYEDFVKNEKTQKDFFGEDIYQKRRDFYETIARLFKAGNLGGIRIYGKKPI